MRTIFWKEWRENWKWAVLAMLALGAAEFYGLLENSQRDYSGLEGLLKPSFLLATTFGCAAAGLILALLQFMPELRRDRWALLLHRPMPHRDLFLGKIGAGGGLYLLAVIPPFLAAALYAVKPGNILFPFVPGMMRPGLADAAVGMAFYGAGVFIALERRWAARILSLLAALFVAAFAHNFGNFYGVLATITFMTAALGSAAWGIVYRNALSRVALCAVLLFGVAAGLGLFLQIASYFETSNGSGTEYLVTDEGQVVMLKYGPHILQELRDLNGQLLQDPRFKGINRFNHTLFFQDVPHYIGESHGIKIYPWQTSYREPTVYVQRVGYDSDEPWFYLPGRRMLLGFDRLSRRSIGFADHTGFHTPEAAPDPIPLPVRSSFWNSQNPALIQSGADVYAFDVENHRLTKFPTEPNDAVFGFKAYGKRMSLSGDLPRVLIAYKNGLRVYRLDEKVPPIFLPYHHDTSRWGFIHVACNDATTRFYLEYGPSEWIGSKERHAMATYIDETDDQGRVLHTYELPPEPVSIQEETMREKLLEATVGPACYLGGFVYDAVGARLFHSRECRYDLDQKLGERWKQTVREIKRIAMASVLFSAIAFFWARRRRHFSLSRARRWALFVLAFNLGGLIVFRLAADWPVEVACPACGRKRPVGRDECPGCGAGWPAPARDGTEIFDSVPG